MILNQHLKCKQKGVQLMILGVPPQLMSKQGNLLCKKFNNTLKMKCLSEGIPYLDSFPQMDNESCFLSDKMHFSETGHNHLGNILFNRLFYSNDTKNITTYETLTQ